MVPTWEWVNVGAVPASGGADDDGSCETSESENDDDIAEKRDVAFGPRLGVESSRF